MNSDISLENICSAIAAGETELALHQLRKFLETSPHLSEAIQLSSRWGDIQHQIQIGTIAIAAATVEKNRVVNAALNLIKALEGNPTAAFGENTTATTPAQNAEKIYNIHDINTANFS